MMIKHLNIMRIALLVILLSFSASGLLCQEEKAETPKIKNNYVKIGANYFSPSEKSFKDIYGEGVTFGGEINIKLWKFINLWLVSNYYSKKGSLPFTKESTKMTLFPIGGGIKLILQKNVINPYIGIGPVLYIYKENNPIGVAEGTGIGIMGEIGCYFRIAGGFLVDASVNYSYCEVKPQKIKANLGGIQAGIGLGFQF